MGTQLGQKILALDPTSDECDVIPLELINGYLAGELLFASSELCKLT